MSEKSNGLALFGPARETAGIRHFRGETREICPAPRSGTGRALTKACTKVMSRSRRPSSSCSRSPRRAAPPAPRTPPATRAGPRARSPSFRGKEIRAARRGSSAQDRGRHARTTRRAPCARRSSRSAGAMGGGASSPRARLARIRARASSRRPERRATHAASRVRSRRARARRRATAHGSWPCAATTVGTWWTRTHRRPSVSPTRGLTRTRRTEAAMRRGSTWAVVDERPKPPSCFTDGGRDAATSDASGDSGRGAGRCGGGLGRRTQLRGASYLAVWVCAMAHGDRGTSPLSRARKVRSDQ